MPGREWCYVREGRRHGPVATAELRRRAAAGEVGPDDLVWPTDDPARAVPARGVKTLFPPPEAAGPPPAAPAPVPPTKPLVPCGRCQAAVSDTAETCPHCGERQPKLDEKERGLRGGTCARCGVFNIGSSVYGVFYDHPGNACRGCGCPMADALPDLKTETEAERVYANGRKSSKGYGCLGAVLAFVVFWAATGADRPLAARLLVGAAAYLAVSYGVGWVIWLLGARRGFWDRSPLTEAVRRRGREGAARDYPDRDALVPWQTVAVGVVLFVGYQGCQAYFIDYKDGRKAGVARVQSMAAGGVFVRDGMTPAKALTMVPADPNASPDWNAGFRDGFKEELERLYPQARK